jgi:hypothetical protein
LVFLSENGLLKNEKLDADEWEAMVLDVAAAKIVRDALTKRLRQLLR